MKNVIFSMIAIIGLSSNALAQNEIEEPVSKIKKNEIGVNIGPLIDGLRFSPHPDAEYPERIFHLQFKRHFNNRHALVGGIAYRAGYSEKISNEFVNTDTTFFTIEFDRSNAFDLYVGYQYSKNFNRWDLNFGVDVEGSYEYFSSTRTDCKIYKDDGFLDVMEELNFSYTIDDKFLLSINPYIGFDYDLGKRFTISGKFSLRMYTEKIKNSSWVTPSDNYTSEEEMRVFNLNLRPFEVFVNYKF